MQQLAYLWPSVTTFNTIYSACGCTAPGCVLMPLVTMPVPAASPRRYSEDVTYGELFLQNEYEMSCYNLDEADVAEQRKRFNLYEAEVRIYCASAAAPRRGT
jgi:hypothetical protein